MSQMNPAITSSKLFRTSVPANDDPRHWYLSNHRISKPPWIAHSHFVPEDMVKHLMRNKKSQAIAVKFVRNSSKPDQITNMEGALHTFCVPIVNGTIHGDYQWRGGHSILEFGSTDGSQLARRVLVSALIQQDFENDKVMLRVARAENTQVVGTPNCPQMISVSAKQDDAAREQYDRQLRCYMIHHLTAAHRLPPKDVARRNAMTVTEAIRFLGDAIERKPGDQMSSHMQERFISHRDYVVSLEVMFRTAFHQVKNEFYALEKVCPQQGYVYTFQPPAIFVRFFDTQGSRSGTELLSRLHIAALKYMASFVSLSACRCIAWSDFGAPGIVSLLRQAIASKSHIVVKSNAEIFDNKAARPKRGEGLYEAPEGAKSAMLVIHNNSDAFGQNIESENAGGSLDGVIGAYSSSAASLLRQRRDLCDHLIRVPP